MLFSTRVLQDLVGRGGRREVISLWDVECCEPEIGQVEELPPPGQHELCKLDVKPLPPFLFFPLQPLLIRPIIFFWIHVVEVFVQSVFNLNQTGRQF